MDKTVSCPNCGEQLQASVEIESVLRTGNFIKVNFVRTQIEHRCCSCSPSYVCEFHNGS